MKKLIDIALKELGESEVQGAANNPRIVEYHQATSLRATDDETPWCSAFVNWVLVEAGLTGTDSAAARSFLKWGEKAEPEVGAIVVFRRGKEPWQGHVGFVLTVGDGYVTTLGGNQSNSVSIKKYPVDDVLDYRKPKAVLSSKTVGYASVAGAAPIIAALIEADISIQGLSVAVVTLISAAGVIWERIKKIKAGA